MKEVGIGTIILSLGFGMLILVFGGSFYAWKSVQVWSASMSGQAVLAEAEYSRQARVEEAKAKEAAAALEGQAELTRAEFAAKANKALAEGLGGPEAYL
jgi:regulator of protease activity HflC (stomatin/prohibitin superfamily)